MQYPAMVMFFPSRGLAKCTLCADVPLCKHSFIRSFSVGDLPRPTLLGAAIDSACLLWQTQCGQRGHCWVYDMDKYRFNLHIVTAGARAVGLLCVSVVCYRVLRHGVPNEDEEDVKARLRREAANSNACAEEVNEMIRHNEEVH